MILLETAQSYLSSGLSVLPAKRQNKCPAIKSWKAFQDRLPTATEVEAWFSNDHDALCIVTGKASGNLEIIDFDHGGELFAAWSALVEENAPGVLDRLVIEQTPSGGWHAVYRCETEVAGNLKLSQGERDDKLTTLIETRGNGGLFLCAPTPKYELVQGAFTAIPTLIADERDLLLGAARQLNEHWVKAEPELAQRIPVSGLLPGEDFNRRGDVKALLEKHGWKYLYHKNDNDYFRRPGKTSGGCSASLKDRTFFVFSSNATPFEAWKSYSPFAVYAHLEHYGDYSFAARDLASQGYGDPLPEPDGKVDISAIVAPKTKEPEPEIKPWQEVNNQDIETVIANTVLGEMCEEFRQVTIPRLPLEAGILKAIVVAGASLSGKAERIDTSRPLYKLIRTGAPLARLCIDTAGGQVANVYSLLIGNSSSGKDIGRLLNHITQMRGWQLPGRASAEGLAETLMIKNNGIMAISEFQDWLNPNHWLNRGLSFFTDSFDAGSFEYGLSKRGGTEKRVATYSYPNILANIQPEIFAANVKRSDISSGFLARFLICNMPVFFGDPADFDLCQSLVRLNDCIEIFLRKEGQVKVPLNYLRHLSEMFKQRSPEKLHPHWRRLVLSYGPRFAVMLSILRTNAYRSEVILDDRCWLGAEKLILWFFGHAERALCDIEDGNPIRRDRERVYRKLFDIVISKGKSNGVTMQMISRHGVWGTTAKERAEGLLELCERGVLRFENGRYFLNHIPVGWE